MLDCFEERFLPDFMGCCADMTQNPCTLLELHTGIVHETTSMSLVKVLQYISPKSCSFPVNSTDWAVGTRLEYAMLNSAFLLHPVAKRMLSGKFKTVYVKWNTFYHILAYIGQR